MRILILTQWFQPEPMIKGLPFAQTLVNTGHEVEVLTGFPNYPSGILYPNYKIQLWRRELMNGIMVNRVILYPNHDRSGFRRIANYLSFSLSSFLIGTWLVKKPDVIYVYNLVTLSLTARILRWIYRCKIVYDIQDLWPESVASSGMMQNAFLLNVLQKWCRSAYQTADRIAVLSPGFKIEIEKRGISSFKIEVIYNWCDESNINIVNRSELLIRQYKFDGTFNIVFAGTMGIMQGLDTILEAAMICIHELPEVRFVLVGGGVERERLIKRANELGLKNVIFIPPQPIQEMGKIFGIAHALLVHLKDDPLFRITIPSKTQAYMFAGIPIIMAVHGDAAELIKQSGSGVVCEPDNPNSLVAAIKSLLKMPQAERDILGLKGKEYYMKHISLKIGVERFVKLFDACKDK